MHHLLKCDRKEETDLQVAGDVAADAGNRVSVAHVAAERCSTLQQRHNCVLVLQALDLRRILQELGGYAML